jgi:hypothetical protein
VPPACQYRCSEKSESVESRGIGEFVQLKESTGRPVVFLYWPTGVLLDHGPAEVENEEAMMIEVNVKEFETCRPALNMSGYRGGPECAGRPARSRWCKSITMKE